MCRDNSYFATKEEHEERYELPDNSVELDFKSSYHMLAGFAAQHIVTYDSVARHNQSFSAHWGLVPKWTKNLTDGLKMSNSMVNARRETIFEKPSFKQLIATSRCLIPSTGFYEHHHLTVKEKVPFYIKVADTKIFSIAGLWTQWFDKSTNTELRSFTMITTASNEPMSRIHNGGENSGRMPLMITPAMEATWLNPNSSTEAITDILNYAIPGEALTYWPVESIRKRGRVVDESFISEKNITIHL